MNASNTKLNLAEKQIFADMKSDYPRVEFVTDFDSIVIAFYKEGNNVRFATAIKSEDEKKFRLKVGQFKAMQRVLPDWNDNYALLPEWMFEDMLSRAGLMEPMKTV